jgi:hypothetical protein
VARRTGAVIMSDPHETALLDSNAGTCEPLDQINPKQKYSSKSCVNDFVNLDKICGKCVYGLCSEK